MQAFHIPAPPPYYTNTFLLISDAGHAVIIDPAADVQNYEQILQEHNAVLTTLLCTHGHFDHVGHHYSQSVRHPPKQSETLYGLQ